MHLGRGEIYWRNSIEYLGVYTVSSRRTVLYFILIHVDALPFLR
jgi:hypothetical protein